ncbi:relaxin receptor 1 isoform X2 [Athalia rosae]|uniref:relaxin receptor 1 isoform X2 n=1 Tax=Athalia rosae TaxID=37344 RepID=UPI0020345745|nr:relaxin receptor 1 isoform X2 [Athalia rosae]
MKYKHTAKVGISLVSFLILLSGLMYYFGQDKCPKGTFPCANCTICISQSAWCNGLIDCPNGDDENEEECFDSAGSWGFFFKNRTTSKCVPSDTEEVFVCPELCDCGNTTCEVSCENVGYEEIPGNMSKGMKKIALRGNFITAVLRKNLSPYKKLRSLYLNENRIIHIEHGAFENQKQLIWFNRLNEIHKGDFMGLESLEMLLIEDNLIEFADLSDFANQSTLEWIGLTKNMICSNCLTLPYLPCLKDLYLDMNQIEEISENLLSTLPSLTGLSLQNNKIRSIHENAFRNLHELSELNLAFNRIVKLPTDLFLSMGNLQTLRLGFNPIENLTISVLRPLQALQSLDVQEIEIDNMDKNMFAMLPNLYFVYFKKFHYCTTYAPHVQVCRPRTDGVSSLSHLLGKPILRAAVWGISCVTCLGNTLVLWGRLTARDENRVLSIIIRNLAVSDMLMGIYLLIIAIKDTEFRNNYNLMANDWMSSWNCTLVGILAMISSEVSVLILSFMSVERFMLIASPLSKHRPLTARDAYSSMIVIWVTGVTIAFVPVIHWRSSTRFYGANGLCFPLHIDNPFFVGWEYSAFIFLGLNLSGLLVIGYAYTGMFTSIWRTRHATSLAVRDSEFALRFFFIVLTDAACWVPIIILKIAAMTNYPVPPDLHAWIVVFILPVNSAVNPLLYTFTTPKFREILGEGWFGRIRNFVSRRQSGQESQISRASSNKNVMNAMSRDNKDPEMNVPGFRYVMTNDGNKVA